MRNYLRSLLVSLFAVTGSLPVTAQEAYAVFTSNGTLTFYYDNQRAHFLQNHGHVYDMPKPGESPTWAGDYHAHLYQKNIKHVVFDDSFSKYRPISTRSWFESCINLKDVKGIRNLNTENVTYMDYMFSGCEALTSLDVSKFNTQNVIYMSGMFQSCKALTSLDVSKFNTQNVTNMFCMFYGCESLTTIFCNSDWNVGCPVNDYSMFKNCTKLKGTYTSFNAKKTGIEMANSTTGYFTSKTNRY